jgi:hypothetical protein
VDIEPLGRGISNTIFWGVEPLPGYVEFARKAQAPLNVKFLHGSAETVDQLALPMVDAVLSNDVLHHVDGMEAAVAAVSRRAAVGCGWWSIEPNWLNPQLLLACGGDIR